MSNNKEENEKLLDNPTNRAFLALSKFIESEKDIFSIFYTYGILFL